MRYLHDPKSCRCHTTVELIAESREWKPRRRYPRRRDDEAVMVHISCNEADLRERVKRLGAMWRAARKLWEITWCNAKRLEIASRVVEG